MSAEEGRVAFLGCGSRFSGSLSGIVFIPIYNCGFGLCTFRIIASLPVLELNVYRFLNGLFLV